MSFTLACLYQGTPAQVSAPALNVPTTSTSGGTLAAATYFYTVTAMDASGNETTPATEVNLVTTGSTSTVTVTWSASTGASSYKIYRRTSTSGGQQILATLGNVLTYTDTGTATTSTSPPSTNATGETLLYTCPSARQVLVKQVIVANNNTTSGSVTLSRVASGGTASSANRILPTSTTVEASDSLVVDLFQPLAVGDFLSGSVSASGMVLTINGVVLT